MFHYPGEMPLIFIRSLTGKLDDNHDCLLWFADNLLVHVSQEISVSLAGEKLPSEVLLIWFGFKICT